MSVKGSECCTSPLNGAELAEFPCEVMDDDWSGHEEASSNPTGPVARPINSNFNSWREQEGFGVFGMRRAVFYWDQEAKTCNLFQEVENQRG